jgi:hypothetical protein
MLAVVGVVASGWYGFVAVVFACGAVIVSLGARQLLLR